jgi:hypothetical protein
MVLSFRTRAEQGFPAGDWTWMEMLSELYAQVLSGFKTSTRNPIGTESSAVD